MNIICPVDFYGVLIDPLSNMISRSEPRRSSRRCCCFLITDTTRSENGEDYQIPYFCIYYLIGLCCWTVKVCPKKCEVVWDGEREQNSFTFFSIMLTFGYYTYLTFEKSILTFMKNLNFVNFLSPAFSSKEFGSLIGGKYEYRLWYVMGLWYWFLDVRYTYLVITQRLLIRHSLIGPKGFC